MKTKMTFKTPYFFAEYELEGDEREVDVLNNMKDLLEFCEEIKFPSESGPVITEPKKSFVPPTEKQIAILKKYNIPYTSTTSCEEAGKLIRDNIEKSR